MPLVALQSAAELRRGPVPDALGTDDLETVAQTVVLPTANDTNDWLTKLIRANAIVKRKPEDAFRVFEPFLEAAAAMGGFSMPMATASALFKSLSATADAVKISGKVRVKVEDLEYFLSGNLEQISNDCLKHVLTFVGDSDRVLKVELCCRRLFELSRCTPLGETMCDLGIGNAPLGAKRFSTAAQLTRVLTRFRLTQVNLFYKTLSTAYVIGSLKAAQPTLTYLVINLRSLEIASTMHFPNLRAVYLEPGDDILNEDNDWANLNSLLSVNGSIEELTYNSDGTVDVSDALFAVLENCKHLRALHLNVNWDVGYAKACRWNLSHLREVLVSNNSIGPVFKPLFHDKLQYLELIESNVDTDIILPPEIIVCTQLYDATPKFLRNLWVDGTLEELTVHCTAKFLPAVVQLCTAVRRLTFQLTASEDSIFGLADGDFINDDTVFADAYDAQNKTAERIEQLIVSCIPADTNYRDIDAEEVIAVLEFLSGNEDLAATTTLCVETEQWSDIQLRYGALVDKLHSSVSVSNCSHSY